MHHSQVTHQNARELKMLATRKATSAGPRRRLQCDPNVPPRKVNVANPMHVILKTGKLSSTATPVVPAQGSPRTAQIAQTITERQQA
mmetsp:Transcript_98832/g.213302  ORF Transcript_98832/g.213302 Transcript_98832/m.213302 type:complete len:87 (+) Transcript_98832:636-896(+)